MVNIELIAGPWDGKVMNYKGVPKTVTGTHGGQRWTYQFTGRHNADGDQLWALVSAKPYTTVREEA